MYSSPGSVNLSNLFDSSSRTKYQMLMEVNREHGFRANTRLLMKTWLAQTIILDMHHEPILHLRILMKHRPPFLDHIARTTLNAVGR